jgi:hypothetical protein
MGMRSIWNRSFRLQHPEPPRPLEPQELPDTVREVMDIRSAVEQAAILALIVVPLPYSLWPVLG